MRVRELLSLEVMSGARLVAGEGGLSRDIGWVHVVDLPDPIEWVAEGHMVLTTGYAWPTSEGGQAELIDRMAARGVSAVGLAVPHFFEAFPSVVQQRADTLALPLLEVPWEIPFARITEAVQRRIIEEQFTVIRRADEIHRALTQAAASTQGLAELTQQFARLLGRPVWLEDHNGAHLSSSAPDLAGPSAGVRKAARGIEAKSGAVRVDASRGDSLAASAVCTVRLGSALAGRLWLLEGGCDLDEVSLRALEHAAAIISERFARQRELLNLELRLGYSFLDSLIDGHLPTDSSALDRARLLGLDPDACYRIGVLALDIDVPLTSSGFALREQAVLNTRQVLEDVAGRALLSLQLNRIIFVYRASVETAKLWRALSSAVPAAGLLVGPALEGLDGLRGGYAKIRGLFPYIAPGAYRTYEDLVVERAMSGDEAAQEHMLRALVEALCRTRRPRVMLATLEALVRHGFVQERAAASLGVHVNTFRYRITRAQELVGLDFGDAEERFRLELTLRLLWGPHKKLLKDYSLQP